MKTITLLKGMAARPVRPLSAGAGSTRVGVKPPRLPRIGWTFPLALALTVIASGCDDGPSAPEVVALVELSPATAEIAVGDSLSLAAVLKGTGGRVIDGPRDVVWSVDTEARATLSGVGRFARVVALEEGPLVVTATVEGMAGTANVVIGAAPPGPVHTVEIDADSLALEEGATHELAATARDAEGVVVSGRFVQWASLDPAIAQISPLGEVTAVRTGATTITARVDGRVDSATVRVSLETEYDLLFLAPELPQAAARRLDIRNPAGEPQAILTQASSIMSVAASPDGSQIAFVGDVPGQGWGVYRVGSSGGTPVRLQVLYGPDDPMCAQLAWSPDGEKLAYTCHLHPSRSHIVVVDALDGGNAITVTADSPGDHLWPSWSPERIDGAYRIAFAHIADGESRIRTMTEDGSDLQDVTSGEWDDQPAWSPDGATIAFQRTAIGSMADLFLVDADGGNVRRLMVAGLAGMQLRPSWSPDGRFIAFSSRHETYGQSTGPHQIYTVWADGTKLARRTHGTLEQHQVGWMRR